MTFLLTVPPAQAAQMEEAQTQVAQAADRVERAAAEIEKAQAKADSAARGYWTAQEQVYAIDIDISQHRARVEALSDDLAEVRSGVRSMAVERYMSVASPTPLLSSATVSEGVRASALADFASTTQFDVIDVYRVLSAEAEEAELALVDERARQREQVAAAAAQQSAIDDELAALADRHEALREELQRFEDAVEVLREQERLAAEAERARIAAEREAAEARAREAAAALPPTPAPRAPTPTPEPTPAPEPPTANTPPTPAPTAAPAVAGATFVCPLSGPFTHVDDFDSPRAVGGVHRANDLISATGTPVLAVVDGVVEHRGNTVGGLSAHLKAPDGDYFYYTHLSGYENEGIGNVTAGTVIGYVGMTGNAPIPHLHFEIHQGGYGNYVNPYPVVQQYC